MKKLISTILILFLCLGIYSCSKKSDEDNLNESTTTDNDTTTDTTAPILTEVTAVDNETTDTTPSYIFSSTEDGTITYGGSCTSSTTSASSGNNSITFSTLSDGTYDNCTVMVTDNASNSSIPLEITTFIIRDFSISSSASDNATVAFGQTYQYQLNTSGTYSGTRTYSLSNEPDNMTISSLGLVEWTPDKGSDITNYDNGTTNSPHTITITVTTASGYVLRETYDLTVTGTCVSGNVMAIWSGDQRSSTDSSKFLGNITAYTDNGSDICGRSNNLDCTAENNYDYAASDSSVNLHIGPTPSATKGNVFFYNQYDNTTHIYLFWMFGVGGSSTANKVHLDVFTANNESPDTVVESDDGGETNRESQSESSGLYSSTYTGRYEYGNCCSDGGVIGPFSGNTYRIFVDLGGKSSLTSSHNTSSADDLKASGVSGYDLGTGNLSSLKYYSKDNSSFSLGNVDNFTVGYNSTLTCGN
jgi:hypothetical protein